MNRKTPKRKRNPSLDLTIVGTVERQKRAVVAPSLPGPAKRKSCCRAPSAPQQGPKQSAETSSAFCNKERATYVIRPYPNGHVQNFCRDPSLSQTPNTQWDGRLLGRSADCKPQGRHHLYSSRRSLRLVLVLAGAVFVRTLAILSIEEGSTHIKACPLAPALHSASSNVRAGCLGRCASSFGALDKKLRGQFNSRYSRLKSR